MAFSVKAKIDGLAPLLRQLDMLKRGARNRVLRPAIRKAATIILKAARAKCPVDTNPHLDVRGLLRKSLGVKMTTYPNGAIVAVIGPRRGFRQQVRTRLRPGKKGAAGSPVYQDPANIAPAVELGHGGPAPAPAHPFMRPAFDENKAAVRQTMAAEIEAGLAKLAKG